MRDSAGILFGAALAAGCVAGGLWLIREGVARSVGREAQWYMGRRKPT